MDGQDGQDEGGELGEVKEKRSKKKGRGGGGIDGGHERSLCLVSTRTFVRVGSWAGDSEDGLTQSTRGPEKDKRQKKGTGMDRMKAGRWER